MTTTAMLVMVIVVAGILLAGIVVMSRSRLREKTAGARAAESDHYPYTGWTPAMFVDGGSSNSSSSDCSPGTSGCDAGGGGGDGGGSGGGD